MQKKRISVSLDITHLCDKNCPLCSHRISGSSFGFLTLDQYHRIAETLRDFSISEIELIGGEPLTHPYFNQLVTQVKKDFPAARLVLVTNGKKLLELSKTERERFSRIMISWYEGFNDLVIEQVVKEKNVFITKPTFLDPFTDPQLSLPEAIKANKNCPTKVIRFVGTRVYGCCLAESIERTYDTGMVHVEVQRNFLPGLMKAPNYLACRHCFYAPLILNNFKVRIKKIIFDLKKDLLSRGALSKFNFGIIWNTWRIIKNQKNWYKYHDRSHADFHLKFNRLSENTKNEADMRLGRIQRLYRAPTKNPGT